MCAFYAAPLILKLRPSDGPKETYGVVLNAIALQIAGYQLLVLPLLGSAAIAIAAVAVDLAQRGMKCTAILPDDRLAEPVIARYRPYLG
jgi:uncharacterized membrane protein YccF (DUF307 family)